MHKLSFCTSILLFLLIFIVKPKLLASSWALNLMLQGEHVTLHQCCTLSTLPLGPGTRVCSVPARAPCAGSPRTEVFFQLLRGQVAEQNHHPRPGLLLSGEHLLGTGCVFLWNPLRCWTPVSPMTRPSGPPPLPVSCGKVHCRFCLFY